MIVGACFLACGDQLAPTGENARTEDQPSEPKVRNEAKPTDASEPKDREIKDDQVKAHPERMIEQTTAPDLYKEKTLEPLVSDASKKSDHFPDRRQPEKAMEQQKEQAPLPDQAGQKIKWASLQWPPSITIKAGSQTPKIYGQTYIPKQTDVYRTKAVPGLKVEIGYGPLGKDPRRYPGDWTWSSSQVGYHKNAGLKNNNQEFVATLKPPSQGGYYHYTYRYSFQNGPWFYGDRSDYGRKGSDDGLQLKNLGVLAVIQPGKQLRIASLNLHCFVDQPTRRMAEIAKGIAKMKIDIIALQEVCRTVSGGIHAADQLARLLKNNHQLDYQFGYVPTHVATHQGKTYLEGLGLLSRHPIVQTEHFPIPATSEIPPKGALPRKGLWHRIATPLGIVSFTSTHFSFRREHEAWRVKQAEELKRQASRSDRSSFINLLGGDFNASPNSSTIKTIQTPKKPSKTPGYTDLLNGFDTGPTFPAKKNQYPDRLSFSRDGDSSTTEDQSSHW